MGPDAPTLTQGAEAWGRLCARLAQRARLDAEIIELTGVVARSGTIEKLEGVPLDTALNLVHRMPAADRSMQLTAADVLADMPATTGLFRAGELSWGQVRAIVIEARRLSRDERGALDALIGASTDRFAKLDPDDAIDAVRIAAEELRDVRATERAEDRAERANFLWAQPAMFGPGKVYGELDNLSLGMLLTGVDAAAPPDDGRSLSQRRADGLLAIATHRCGDHDRDDACCDDSQAPTTTGEDGAGGDDEAGEDAQASQGAGVGRRPTRHPRLSPAVPAASVIVDLRDVSRTAAGTIAIDAPGCLPTLTARAVEALAADATVQVVLVDGARPLAATRKVWAKTIPADVRRAVLLRDGGDRFPGSRRHANHVHHLDKRRRGHHPDALLGLADVSHQRVHRHGWHITLHPDTGEATFTRAERQWTTLPRRTRLRRIPPPSDDDGP
jgi:hypothetical protein